MLKTNLGGKWRLFSTDGRFDFKEADQAYANKSDYQSTYFGINFDIKI